MVLIHAKNDTRTSVCILSNKVRKCKAGYVWGYKSSYFKGYTCKWSLIMRHWAHSCLVFCLTFLFIDFFLFFVLCSEGDRMNPQSGFYLNMFLTLNSNPLIWNKLWCSLLHLKGQTFFQKRKKNTWKPNVVLSEFLIMYSFGDFKFVPLYF